MLRNVTSLGRVLYQTKSQSARVQRSHHVLFRTLSNVTFPNVLASLEEKARGGNPDDMLMAGRQLFDQNVSDKAEYWLCKAAELGNLEAQYLAGVLLVSTPQSKSGHAGSVSLQDSSTVTVEASNASEVRSQIMKLRKESMFEKRGKKSNLEDFNEALRKRKEKQEQQEQQLSNPTTPISPTKPAKSVKATSQPVATASVTKPDNRIRGLKWLQKAAKSGHGQAMCFLGNELLSEGQRIVLGDLPKNTSQDISQAKKLIHQAVDWYALSAQDGLGVAAYNLGVLFHDGVEHTGKVMHKAERSVLPDLMVTKVSFQKGEATESSQLVTTNTTTTNPDTNSPDSAPITTTIVPVSLPDSLSYFIRAAELGEPAAKLWCGYCYCTEQGGVTEVQPHKAVRYLNSACEHQETAAKAHFYLSQIYRSGLSAGAGEREGEEEGERRENVGKREGEEEGEGEGETELQADHELFLQHLQLAVQGGDEAAVHLLADLHLQRHFTLEQEQQLHYESEQRPRSRDRNEAQSGDKEVNKEVNEEEEREAAFLQADLIAAPAPVHTKHAPHVHTDSCGASYRHAHDHAHHHDHQDHKEDSHTHQHDHNHKQSESVSSSPSSPLSPSILSNPVPNPNSNPNPIPTLSKQHLLRAVVLLVQASAAGHAEATLTLGALTYQGKLPPQLDTDGAPISNKRRAFELYQLAAEQGSDDAWRNVASMHFLGDGVPKSEELAREIMKVVFGKK